MRHGGQILIDQLKIQGVDRVFCLPGESYLAALDGLFETWQVNRQAGRGLCYAGSGRNKCIRWGAYRVAR